MTENENGAYLLAIKEAGLDPLDTFWLEMVVTLVKFSEDEEIAIDREYLHNKLKERAIQVDSNFIWDTWSP